MSQQPQQPGTDTDINAADLDADVEVAPGDAPATSDPDAFTDDGLGMGDGPDVHSSSDSGS